MSQDHWIRNSLCVAPAGPQALYVLTTVYPESDALNPAGQLLHHVMDDEGLTESILSTPRPLAAMWRSPAGHLWLAGADGSAWTTAPTPWQAAAPPTETSGPLAWTHTQAPPLAKAGHAPNFTAVWGTSDSQVFFATASGSVYRWDGSGWHEQPTGADASLNKLHGTAANDAYVVGYRGTIAHWDGQAWAGAPAPDIDPATTIVTGVAALTHDEVYAVTNRGQLLKRSDAGFALLDQAQGARFSGVAPAGQGLVISSATGAWLFDHQGLRQVKANFSATDVQAVAERLYFIETEQPHGPACIEYFAGRATGSPWQRLVF
ncbi:WD40/YVTN/BNR-like repeat-containing protein [Roseateles sp. DXS20W]|uniref:WD40/YVTN/BNR-like repeat-containing protein n=1 Tax=Pelomonas lactea TaxID=3299030 RepID=A0ABW7GDF1_9BURK